MLMLPLAATFSRSIELFGFDGRNPEESYFWRHGTTVQFDEELEDIRLVHPGFFELDYDDYYDQHVATVEQMFLDIELRGGTVTSRTPSFMRPLRRRSAAIDQPTASNRRAIRRRPTSDLIVSITPDWTGDFGHFGPWERAVGAAARSAWFQLSLARQPGVGAARRLRACQLSRTERCTARCADSALFECELRDGLDATGRRQRQRSCASMSPMSGTCRPCSNRRGTADIDVRRQPDAIAHRQSSAALSRPTRSNIPCSCSPSASTSPPDTNVHVCLDTRGDHRRPRGDSSVTACSSGRW